MAVYHFTLHAYRSWRPDHPRGFTIRHQGYQLPNPEKADLYDARAKQPPILFDDEIQRLLFRFALQICSRLNWTLEAVGFDSTHFHVLISWHGFHSWKDVDRRLKNLLSLLMNRERKTPRRRWFVQGRSAPRQVRNRKHYDHLVGAYFPDHPGLYWKRGLKITVD